MVCAAIPYIIYYRTTAGTVYCVAAALEEARGTQQSVLTNCGTPYSQSQSVINVVVIIFSKKSQSRTSNCC